VAGFAGKTQHIFKHGQRPIWETAFLMTAIWIVLGIKIISQENTRNFSSFNEVVF